MERIRDSRRLEGIRGGVAWLPVLTGVVVAFGTLLLLSAIVAAVLVATDTLPAEGDDAATLGVAGAISLLVAQLAAYLWGGYTAGRMARGAGILNGFLVALIALLLASIAGAIATVANGEVNLNVPFTAERLPIDEDVLVEWSIGYGVVTLLVMFGFAVLGGAIGARWHTRLEEEHVEADVERRSAAPPVPRETIEDGERTIDVTEDERAPGEVTIGNRPYRSDRS